MNPEARAPERRPLSRSSFRWLLLCILIGVVAGLGAIAFYELVHLVTDACLGWAGYHPVRPRGESGETLLARLGVSIAHSTAADALPPSERSIVWWKALLLPAAGGLIVGLLIQRFSPEARGHGTDAAIAAYHHKRGVIKPAVIWVKAVASAITLGTGGSGGQEGPITQIGAGFGSHLATMLKLTARERRILLAVGMGAGVAAIFRTPLAGALFAAEILYSSNDFESEVILPSIVGCVISYSVFTWPYEQGTLFATHLTTSASALKFHHALELIPYTALGLVLAIMVIFYAKVFYGIEAAFHRLRIPSAAKPMIGGLLTGALAVAFYTVIQDGRALNLLSFGYGAVQEAFDIPTAAEAVSSPWLLAALLFSIGVLKILATSFTIGSGGSAGLLGPSMVVGGTVGAAVGVVFQQIWPMPLHPGTFAIVGMAGFFTGAACVPISTLIMVGEITGNYQLLIPVMWVEAMTYALTRGHTIYKSQVRDRTASPAHRGDFLIDVLEDLPVSDLLKHLRPAETLRVGTSFRDVMDVISKSKTHYYPILNEQSGLVGIFSVNDVRAYIGNEAVWDLLVVEDVMTRDVLTVTPADHLGRVMRRFTERNIDEIPVVAANDPSRVLGMLRRREVIQAYNQRLDGLQAEARAEVA
jgi:CIC family chloride channel protein